MQRVNKDNLKQLFDNIIMLNKRNIKLSIDKKVELSIDLFKNILNYVGVENEGIIYTIVRLFANIPFACNVELNFDLVDKTNFNCNNCSDEKKLIINIDNDVVRFYMFGNELENNFESSIKICSDDIFDYIYIDGDSSSTKMTFSKEGIELDREVIKTYKDDDIGLLSVVQQKGRDSNLEYFTTRNIIKLNNYDIYNNSDFYGISNMPVDERIIFPNVEKRVFGTDYIDPLYENTLFRYNEKELSQYFPNLINNILCIDDFKTKVKRP